VLLFVHRVTVILRFCAVAAIIWSRSAGAVNVTPAVEFYDAARDHYFVTASPPEIADLDTGVHPGWRRTGLTFGVFDASAPGTSPVCRFYLPPASGDSHFYSASAAECAATQTRFPAFVLESADVFDVVAADTATGACPLTTIPVYRLWNGRADSNHRYTTDPAISQRMRDAGWIAEGYGPAQTIMCAPSPATGSVDVALAGRAIIKARASGNVVAALAERLTSIFEDGPDRVLDFVQSDGHGLAAYAPPAGWSIADFALHPSGEASVVLTTKSAVRLVRLDRRGGVRSDQSLVDPAAATDPHFDFAIGIEDDAALQPVLMHDAARLVALGESVALVLRTGRNAVVAYRFDVAADATYRRAWRTLVEPGASIAGVFLTSGSFDTFGQLSNHVTLHADADAAGNIAVAVVESPFRSFVFEAHAMYYGEPIAAQNGILVTRIAAADGARLGSTAIDTRTVSELHGLRATPDGFLFTGRVRTAVPADGSGWDAFVARIASDGSITSYRVLDVDRGDVLFDAAPLDGGRYVALGTTGYVQNPTGASISEETQPLLLVLDADGRVLQRIPIADGPRQDQLRTMVTLGGGRWILGGMRNGPGTHSGDAQPQLISADGFLVEMALPASARAP
jgi:hypothetical protein